MNQKTLSIIIVSFNTANLTLQAINAVIDDLLLNSSLLEKTELIIIDNNSKDDSVKMIKELISNRSSKLNISLTVNKKNLGFAQANNLGISKSQGKYIFLLNSDTIIQTGALEQLIKTFEQHPLDGTTSSLSSHKNSLDHLGILSASLLNSDGSPQPQGGSLPALFPLFNQMFFLDDLPVIGKWLPTLQETGKAKKTILSNNKPYQKGWVAGTAMMLRKELIEDIGALDENIFMYGEDVEYCMRAKHHHWDIAIDPTAKVVHFGSASSSSETAILGEIQSYLYIWAKHKPHWQRKFLKAILYSGILLRIFLFGVILNNKKLTQGYQKAISLLN